MRRALSNGHIHIAQYLLEKGADCSQLRLHLVQNQEGWQWLYEKIQKSANEFTENLLAMDSDKILNLEKSFFEKDIFLKNFNPRTQDPFVGVLGLAVQSKNRDAVAKLIIKRENVSDYYRNVKGSKPLCNLESNINFFLLC